MSPKQSLTNTQKKQSLRLFPTQNSSSVNESFCLIDASLSAFLSVAKASRAWRFSLLLLSCHQLLWRRTRPYPTHCARYSFKSIFSYKLKTVLLTLPHFLLHHLVCLCYLILKFSLNFSEPPDPPELEVREVKDRSMNLRWTQRFDGNSVITSYDIEYKNKTGNFN